MPEAVRLRIVIEGECDCGTSKTIDAPRNRHQHHIECDWGRIEYGCPDKIPGNPGHVRVGHLILAGYNGFVSEMLKTGKPIYAHECINTVTTDGERIFLHAEAGNGRWTWELFEAYFTDGLGPDDILVGRWPD